MPASDTPVELLTRLVYAPQYPYPKSIIKEMIDRREEMTPALLEVLVDAERRPEHYLEGNNWKLVTFACYLLAQFRVTAAFKPLCALLGTPGETTDLLFGEMITEDMGRILASVYDGDDTPLRAVVENESAYEFVRGSAAVNCYECLLVAGRMTRETLEAYATELLSSKLEREPSNAWDNWTSLCADLGFASTVPLIQKANEDYLCDPWFYGIEKLLKRAANGGSEHWKRRTALIEDTISATSSWAAWQKPQKVKPRPIPPKLVEARQTAKVGRNDPCPCGSGKKFKKCCGVASTGN